MIDSKINNIKILLKKIALFVLAKKKQFENAFIIVIVVFKEIIYFVLIGNFKILIVLIIVILVSLIRNVGIVGKKSIVCLDIRSNNFMVFVMHLMIFWLIKNVGCVRRAKKYLNVRIVMSIFMFFVHFLMVLISNLTKN